MNRGVSACATCDGALYRGREMAVVGGGDTAMGRGPLPHPVRDHRPRDPPPGRPPGLEDHGQAGDGQPRRSGSWWDSVVEEVLGNQEGVTDLRLRNLKTGAESGLPVGALFIAIGHVPNTEIFAGALELDDRGYVVVHPGRHDDLGGRGLRLRETSWIPPTGRR